MHSQNLTRETIIETLVNVLQPLNFIHAFWEGGAAAFKRIDEWSDLDLYLIVDDKKIDESFNAFEEALRDLSPIKQRYVVQHPPKSKIFQAFYRLDNTSEYQFIDLAILTLSSPEKFLEPKVHGEAIFYFKKLKDIKPPTLNKKQFIKKLQERLDRLQSNFAMFNNIIQKEINRGNSIEAIYNYRVVTLNSLVEVLRIKHYPIHHDFRTRYIHYELHQI